MSAGSCIQWQQFMLRSVFALWVLSRDAKEFVSAWANDLHEDRPRRILIQKVSSLPRHKFSRHKLPPRGFVKSRWCNATYARGRSCEMEPTRANFGVDDDVDDGRRARNGTLPPRGTLRERSIALVGKRRRKRHGVVHPPEVASGQTKAKRPLKCFPARSNGSIRCSGAGLVYVHMQKAAGSTIKQILGGGAVCAQLEVNCVAYDMAHLRPKKTCRSCDKHFLGTMDRPNHTMLVGSVRNPFDWYVSLYSFGVEGHGQLAEVMRSNYLEPDSDILDRSNSSKTTVERFRAWMRVLFEGHGRDDASIIAAAQKRKVGLMTYRFGSLYSKSSTAMVPHFDYFLRTEHLRETMVDMFLKHAAERGRSDLDAARVRDALQGHIEHANASPRAEKTAQAYYDKHTRRLVRRGDAMLLKMFGYDIHDDEPPSA